MRRHKMRWPFAIALSTAWFVAELGVLFASDFMRIGVELMLGLLMGGASVGLIGLKTLLGVREMFSERDLPRFGSSQSKARADAGKLPSLAVVLLRLVLSRNAPHQDREALIGDLHEYYNTVLRREHSPLVAKLIFWCDALREIGPTLKRSVRWILIRLAALSGLAGTAEVIRRVIGS